MKDIKGYEGLYAVTSCGKVWSYRRQRFLRACDNGHGYLIVDLYKNNTKKMAKVHKLVAEAYLPNPHDLPIVDHKDNNKANNNVNNLQWVTASINASKDRVKGIPRPRAPIVCVETGKVFSTQKEAAEFVGIHRQGIVNCLAGKQKTAGGYHWARMDV